MPVSVRLSELTPISQVQLTDTDLFLVTDSEASSSKKLTLLELKTHLFSGNSFASFNDVDLSSTPPQDGQFLRYDGASSKWQAGDISLSSLGDLNDVDLVTTPPSDDQTLIWDGNKFVPGTINLGNLYTLLGKTISDSSYNSFTGNILTGSYNVRSALQTLSDGLESENQSRVLSSTAMGLEISNLDQRLDALNIDISPETLNSISELSAALQDNPDVIGDIQTSVTSLETSVSAEQTAQDARLTQLESDISGLEIDISPETLNTINELAETLQDNPNIISEVQGQISSLSASIATEQSVQDGRLTTIESGQTTQDGRLTTIETGQTTQDGRLTQLESDVAGLDIDISPDALNSINELSEALNDDPDFLNTLNGSISLLQSTLNKLVPPAPTTLAGLPVNVLTNEGTERLCVGFTDRTGGTSGLVAGSTVKRNTDGSISTDKIQDVGPGDSGQVSAKISSATYDVSTTMTSDVNSVSALGLEISDNKDASLSTRDSGIQADFYQVYDIRLLNAGLNNEVSGLHEVSFSHAGNTTDKGYFYEDESTPGAPTLICSSVYGPMSPVYNYSSGIPHYSNHTDNLHDWGVIIGNASGDMYTNHTLVTTSDTTAWTDPGDITYTQCGGTNPPAKNFLVGTTTSVDRGQYPKDIHTTVSGTNGFANFTISTPYGSASDRPTSNSQYNIMGNTSRTNVMDEDNILVSNLGVGAGNGYRVGGGTGDNPVPSYTDWVSTNVPSSEEAIVRGGVLRHDVTNYSSGYHPVGPDLSVRPVDPQYFQVEIRRSAVSQFEVSYQGSISGCWVSMPDNTAWNNSLSGTNGWADMVQSYRGSGIPTSSEPGCSSGGVMDNNGGTFTCVFGTESSSNDPESRILVRWKLSNGQSITSMSFSS